MTLEVNQEHTEGTFDRKKRPIKKLPLFIAGLTLTLALYTGVLPPIAYATSNDTPPGIVQMYEEQVVVPDSLKSSICSQAMKGTSAIITKQDLQMVSYLYLSEIPDDMSFLQYCTNLETLMITADDSTSLDFIKLVPNLKSLHISFKTSNKSIIDNLPSIEGLESFQIFSLPGSNIELTQEDMSIMDKFPQLKKLGLSNVGVAPGWEERLNQLDELELSNGRTYDIDFTQLTGIKKLVLKHTEPYTTAIFLSSAEYQTLLANGVTVEFASDQDRELYQQASAKIDQIVSQLDITENSSDQEKLDTILIYVLEHLEYDPLVKEAFDSGISIISLTQQFYSKGDLYGALEMPTAICGNYAALVEALMDRVSVPQQSTIATSSNHAWNLVKVDGQTYLVDATWLDGVTLNVQKDETTNNPDGSITITFSFESQTAVEAMLSGRSHDLRWYMEDPSPEHVQEIDKHHAHEGVIPSYMLDEMEAVDGQQEEQQEQQHSSTQQELPSEETAGPTIIDELAETAPDITHEKVKIKIGTKEYIIGGGALVGIMAGIGTAIAIKKKKEEERRRRMRMQQHSYYPSSYGSFSSSYDDPFHHRF